MRTAALFLALALSFIIGVTVGVNARQAPPTLKNCTRWAEAQPGYPDKTVDNILRRDSLIRECMGTPRAAINKGA